MSRAEPFVCLPENRFALTAVESWANARKAPAPVYLYGPSGVGKSHLARHGLRLLAARKPTLRVVHQDASEFAAEFADASSRKEIARFQAEHRDLECFILEDVHALEGRPETQQQLLAALDDLAPLGCRMLWTSRKSPGELQDFSKKLTDRFHQGVTALLRLPNAESRKTLIEHFAHAHELPLTPALAGSVARRMPVSPRELLGIVVQLETRSRAAGRAIDPVLLRQVLSGAVAPRSLRLEEVARAVARHFQVTLTELRSPERSRHLMIPRHCGMFLSRELTDEGLAAIGEFYHRNHSTVVHACDSVRAHAADDAALRSHLAQLRQTLGAAPA